MRGAVPPLSPHVSKIEVLISIQEQCKLYLAQIKGIRAEHFSLPKWRYSVESSDERAVADGI